MGLAVDERGNVYAADRDSRSILRFHPDGTTDVVARLGMFWSPTALALSGSSIYVLVNLRFPTPGFLAGVFGNPTLQKVSADGRITTVSTVGPRLRWNPARAPPGRPDHLQARFANAVTDLRRRAEESERRGGLLDLDPAVVREPDFLAPAADHDEAALP